MSIRFKSAISFPCSSHYAFKPPGLLPESDIGTSSDAASLFSAFGARLLFEPYLTGLVLSGSTARCGIVDSFVICSGFTGGGGVTDSTVGVGCWLKHISFHIVGLATPRLNAVQIYT